MKIISLYLKEKKYLYVFKDNGNVENGEIDEKEIEEFLKERKPQKVHLTISKPRVLSRKLTFPFSQKRKIEMVLIVELEDLLPEPTENFVFSWYFISQDKEKSTIMVSAIGKDFYAFWKKIEKEYRLKVTFFIDSLLIFSIFKDVVKEKNHFFLFLEKNYFLINMVENNALSNSYSYYFDDEKHLSDRLNSFHDVFSEKNYPVLWYDSEKLFHSFPLKGETVSLPEELSSGIEPSFFIPNVKIAEPFSRLKLQFTAYGKNIRITLPVLVFTLAFLFIAVFMFFPYFQISEQEKKLNDVKTQMVRIFKATCPEVSKVVDPLVQIKEKLKDFSDDTVFSPGTISILKTMADLTTNIPEEMHVEISQFIVSGNSLFISGKIDDLKKLEKLKVSLEKSIHFFNVKIGDISFDNERYINFDLMTKLK